MNADFPAFGGEDSTLLRSARTAFFPDTPQRIGVAVSGGGDSMAALHLLHHLAPQTGWHVHAVTVDHGLRPESAAEATFVAEICAGLGVPHEIVKWTGWNSKGNLQDQARRARYRLVSDWASRHELTHIVLGHTVDDQAETFLMRLARSSGVDGLAGMRARWTADGHIWSRPFLFATRQDLREYLIRRKLSWIDDPSNEDTRFDRVKARKTLAMLAPLGITQGTLSDVAGHLTSARDALTHTASEFAGQHCEIHGGDLLIQRDPLINLPYDLFRRVTIGAFRWMTGADYAPRAQTLENLHGTIVSNGRPRTLARCRITTSPKHVRIAREYQAVCDVDGPVNEAWDNRWKITGPHAPDILIRALGDEGLKYCPDWRESGLPRASLMSSPAIWQGENLIAAPLAGLNNGWSADLAPNRNNFASFLLSH